MPTSSSLIGQLRLCWHQQHLQIKTHVGFPYWPCHHPTMTMTVNSIDFMVNPSEFDISNESRVISTNSEFSTTIIQRCTLTFRWSHSLNFVAIPTDASDYAYGNQYNYSSVLMALGVNSEYIGAIYNCNTRISTNGNTSPGHCQ